MGSLSPLPPAKRGRVRQEWVGVSPKYSGNKASDSSFTGTGGDQPRGSEPAVRAERDQLKKRLGRLSAELAQLYSSLSKLDRFRTIIDRAGEAIFITDPETGRFVDVNETACKWLGYSRAQLLAMSVHDVQVEFPLTGFQDSSQHVANTRHSDRPRIIGRRLHRRRNGTAFPVEVAYNQQRFGDRCYDLVVVRDLKERDREQDRKSDKEDRYRFLFELAKDAVYLTGRDGRVIDANDQALEFFGYTRAELLNQPARSLYVNGNDVRGFQEAVEELGIVRGYQVDFLTKDGSVVPGVLTAALRHGGNGTVQGYQCIVRSETAKEATAEEFSEFEALVSGLASVVPKFPDAMSRSAPRPSGPRISGTGWVLGHNGEVDTAVAEPDSVIEPAAAAHKDVVVDAPEPIITAPPDLETQPLVDSEPAVEAEPPLDVELLYAPEIITEPEPVTEAEPVHEPAVDAAPASELDGETDAKRAKEPEAVRTADRRFELDESGVDYEIPDFDADTTLDADTTEESGFKEPEIATDDVVGFGEESVRYEPLVKPEIRRKADPHIIEVREERASAESAVEPAGGSLMMVALAGALLMAVAWTPLARLLYPFDVGAGEWRFATGILGASLITKGLLGREWSQAGLALVVALLLYGATMIGAFAHHLWNLPFGAGDLVPQARLALAIAIAKATLFMAVLVPICGWLAWYLWRRSQVDDLETRPKF